SNGYCTAVMIGGVQTTACVPKTCVWSNNAYTAKAGSAYLDQCNGHGGRGDDYHYHATSTFPYIAGCYRGTPTNNGGSGTPPAATRPMRVRSWLPATDREVGAVALVPQTYCQLHYLIARAGHDSPGLPSDLDMVDASLHIDGTYRAPGSASPTPFTVHTAVANG